MDYSNLTDKELLELAKENKVKFAGEVSKKIRSTSSREGGVQDLNSAPNLNETNINFKKIQMKKKQIGNADLFDKNDVSINELTFKEASVFIKANHYSHTMPVTNVYLGFSYKNKLNLVIVYGTGACYRLKK